MQWPEELSLVSALPVSRHPPLSFASASLNALFSLQTRTHVVNVLRVFQLLIHYVKPAIIKNKKYLQVKRLQTFYRLGPWSKMTQSLSEMLVKTSKVSILSFYFL